MRILLASASARRRKILSATRMAFEAVKPDINERSITGRNPEETAKRRALAKAADVAHRNPDALAIGADTIILIDGKIAGKPAKSEDADRMLCAISGKKVKAITAIALVCEEKDIGMAWAENATVKFIDLPEKSAQRYLRSRKWKGKAGGFNIDEMPAKKWVEKITGERETVVGLPTKRLLQILEKLEGKE